MSLDLTSGPVQLDELAAITPGTIVSRMLLKRPTGSVTLFAFAEGEGLSEHTAPFDALIIVTTGTADIRIDGVSYSVSSGSAIHLPANVPHAVQASTDVRLLLTMLRA
jgi:quercetin dioxygenase-like cupin family protein